MADTEIIPVIDLGPYLAGAPGAIDRTAGELRFALTEIGFYFIVNHGVPSGQIREVFRQVARLDIDRQTEPTAPENSDFSEADEKVLEQIKVRFSIGKPEQ